MIRQYDDEDFDIILFKKYGDGHVMYEKVKSFIHNLEGEHSMYYMGDLTLNKMMERSEEVFKLRTNVCRTIWEYLKLDDKGDTDVIKVKYVKQAIEQALSGQKYD